MEDNFSSKFNMEGVPYNRLLDASYKKDEKKLLVKMEVSSSFDEKYKKELYKKISQAFKGLSLEMYWQDLEEEKSEEGRPIDETYEYIPEESSPEGDGGGSSFDLGDLEEISQPKGDPYQQDDEAIENFLAEKEREDQAYLRDQAKLKKKSKPKKMRTNKNYHILMGKGIKIDEITEISEIEEDGSSICIEGQVQNLDIRDTKSGKSRIFTFDIEDRAGAISCKIFAQKRVYENFIDSLQDGVWLLLEGIYRYDPYSRSRIFFVDQMEEIEEIHYREDKSIKKHIPLHIHTKMTQNDGFIEVEDLFKRLKDWGIPACGITDQNCLQSWPEAYDLSKKTGIKAIYGADLNICDDKLRIFSFPHRYEKKDGESFIVLDIETTGLNQTYDRITEIGAVRVIGDQIVDTYSQLVNPKIPIPENITKITGITDEMVEGKPDLSEIWDDFIKFIGDGIIVAHNADFDYGFLHRQAKMMGKEFSYPYLDTMKLGRALYPQLKNHKLDTLSKEMGVSLINHHRAHEDAYATAQIFIKLVETIEKKGYNLENVNQIETSWPKGRNDNYTGLVFCQKQESLKNFYELISLANTKYMEWQPSLPFSLLDEKREGLLIGSGGRNGQLFQALRNGLEVDRAQRIAKRFDFLQIEPSDLHNSGNREDPATSPEEVERINELIIDLGERLSIPVIATEDVRYLDKEDNIIREILLTGSDRNKRNPAKDFAPVQYLRTSQEVMEDFSYLEGDKREEVLIENPQKLADSVDDIIPIPQETYPPVIEGSDQELRDICFENAHKLYGDPLPEYIEERLEKELNSIISNGYAVLYIIARKLVLKSNSDGYLVGSRGSVGSSFVATMSDITEVNPLRPHYRCPKCKKTEFFSSEEIASGFDLPDKKCPDCGTDYVKDGHDIPFEVFLGFEGDKEPDIDLNFAGEYQPVIHKYTEELFGEGKVFRAGTIGTVQENTAYGYIKSYYEKKDLPSPNEAEIRRLQRKLTNVKRSSGQHPGGIIIVPSYKNVFEITPIQYAADDKKLASLTTHYTYNSLHSTLLKLDELGHDGPTFIKMLTDLSGEDALEIPMDDKETMSIFSSTDALNAIHPYSNEKFGTIGIPEFGTGFVRSMLQDTKPTTFGELTRISGLSHGTDVWLNNAQDLIREGKTDLPHAICTRDDIMLYLISKGVEKKTAFNIMEKVRKGKHLDQEYIDAMKENDVPDWYIESCEKIKYMFPKAHAVAYVMVSFRIAYYKVHFPQAFYASYFTIKIQDYPGGIVYQGLSAVQNRIQAIQAMDSRDQTAKDKSNLTILEVIEEMLAREIDMLEVDLYESEACKFILKEGKILPPLAAVENVSEQMALSIVEAREDAEFMSIQDLMKRTRLNKTALESLKRSGVLSGLSETNQLSFF